MKTQILEENNGVLVLSRRSQDQTERLFDYNDLESLIHMNYANALFDTYRVIKGQSFAKENRPEYAHFIYSMPNVKIPQEYDIVIHYVDVEDREDQYFGVIL